MKQITELNRIIQPVIDQQLNQQSRCHPLSGYLDEFAPDLSFIKREDELNASTMGTKHRKYLSLLPYIQRSGSTEIILIGSAQSNNILGLTRLLKEQSIGVTVMVNSPRDQTIVGNRLFLHLLLPNHRINYIARTSWPNVATMATQLADKMEKKGHKVLVIPEGGFHQAVLPGILTLAQDITRNEQTLGVKFADIWTDSGTGVSAIGLLLGMRLLGMAERKVHITQIAGNPKEFMSRYRLFEDWLASLMGTPLPKQEPAVTFIPPTTAAAYGSINSTVMEQIKVIARETGILMDPVYSVKHLYTVKHQLTLMPANGPQLILYNGSSMGLCGFQAKLATDLLL